MNPLASHWFRLAVWLFLASPIIAILVAFSAHADFMLALNVTLSIWVLVCLILALIALGGLLVRAAAWAMRAVRGKGVTHSRGRSA